MSEIQPRRNFLAWQTDLSAADWIVESLHEFAADVGSVMPPVFEAYARVFHPARRRFGPPGPDMSSREVTWRSIAEANGRVFHPEVQFGNLVGGWRVREQPGIWDEEPVTGTLPHRVARQLVLELERFTSTPERCWFAVWEGWGGMERTLPRGLPRIHVPQRAYFLAAAPISAALQSVDPPRFPWTGDPQFADEFGYRSANIWWPDDRAWCVATEVDFTWTYVGGRKDCIDALLSDPHLEALPAKITDHFTYLDDHVNPPVGGWS